MELKRYRVAIIGCGWVGVGYSSDGITWKRDTHIRAYQSNPRTEVITMCDKDAQKVVRVFSKYSNLPAGVWPADALWVEYLPMVKRMNLDIVSVCTSPETHSQIVCDIAPYVKAIYCEKPIADTIEDAQKMIDICHKHKVILQVNHERRFIHPKFTFSRGIMDNGTHAFDLLRQLFGQYLGGYQRYSQKTFTMLFGRQWVEIEYKDTAERFFNLDCVRSSEPMIGKGVEHLVQCL